MKISLRTKLIISFLAVIIICGLVATIVGSRLIATGIIRQAQDKVKIDLNSAREIYREKTEDIKDIVRFTAVRFFIIDGILENDTESLKMELEEIRKRESLDILTLTDKYGRVIVRSCNPSVHGDNQAHDDLVGRVLSGREVVALTVIVPREELVKEGEDLEVKDLLSKNLKKALSEAARCKDIVKGLLDFARQTEPRFEERSVNEVLDRAWLIC